MDKTIAKKEHITLCLFDVLGVSEMTRQNELDRVYSYYCELSETINHDSEHTLGGKLIGTRVPVPQPDGTIAIAASAVRIYHTFFSDNFILWTESHPLGVWTFDKVCNEVFCMAIENHIPIRGCISSGEAIMDLEKRIFVGNPLVEAAQGYHSK